MSCAKGNGTDILPKFWKILAAFNGAIIGSVAQWPTLSYSLRNAILWPKDLNIVMENDGILPIERLFHNIRFASVEDRIEGLQVGHCFVHFCHNNTKEEIIVIILYHSCNFYQFLLLKVHSGLMNAILLTEFVFCFPSLMANREVIAHAHGINSEASKAIDRGFKVNFTFIRNPQRDKLKHYIDALDYSISSGYANIFEGMSKLDIFAKGVGLCWGGHKT